MPFTVSHTVAVIPLYKYLGKFGALSALIIGSMTPDFAYLVPWLVDNRLESHSLVGIYLFAIPMGLTVYFLYHFLMAPVLVSLMPQVMRKHLNSDLFVGQLPKIPSYALVFSIVLGAITHVFWDFFTHQSGIPQYVHWMDVPLTAIDGYDIMPYRVLQHFSSLFGLSLLSFWIWRWLARRKDKANTAIARETQQHWQAPKGLKIFSLVVLFVVPFAAAMVNGYRHLPNDDSLYGMYAAQVFVRFGVTGAAGAFILSATLLGLLYQFVISRAKT